MSSPRAGAGPRSRSSRPVRGSSGNSENPLVVTGQVLLALAVSCLSGMIVLMVLGGILAVLAYIFM